jgi:putative zinc finger/helix-turn-helix YgiT family protein
MGRKNDLESVGQASETVCPACGASAVAVRRVVQPFEYGEGAGSVTLEASIEVGSCAACGLEFTTGEAERARHDAVCRFLGVMTPREIRALRKRYALSQTEFARLTRVGEASVTRWENALLIQNGGYDQFLYLLTFSENLERLRDHPRTQPDQATRGMSVEDSQTAFQRLRATSKLLHEASLFELRPTGTEG